jgi:hypothetical protein
MAVSIDKKFRFVSPGVFISEIDNSQLPKQAEPIGPVIIGRTARGPGMVPVQVGSFSDFVEMFGNPVAGGSGDDVWRDGNFTSPMYATYAAQAWLKNSNKATIVRLLGDQSDTATGTKAGWKLASNATYGLFLIDSASSAGTLAAVFYTDGTTQFELTGTLRADNTATRGVSSVINNNSAGATYFLGQFSSSAGFTGKTKFNFDENSEFYIRKVFNTNPILTNATVTSTTTKYFLGETFEENVRNLITSSANYGVVLKLANSAQDYGDHMSPSVKSQTGWIFSQDLSANNTAYDPANMQKLFYFQDLGSGESNQRQFKISIQDIKPSSNSTIPYGTFSVVVRQASDSDAAPKVVETFTNCDLNPFSENYVAKKIGDQFMQWSDSTNSYTLIGNYPNRSKFVRVVMNSDVDAGSVNPAYLPFGCYLPPRPANFSITNGLVSPATNVATSSTTIATGSGALTAAITYPKFVLRNDTLTGSLSSPSNAYWGVTYNKKSNLIYADKSYIDLVRYLSSTITSTTQDAFTLDDISGSSLTASSFTYSSGSRVAGTSLTVTNSYTGSLNAGINRFNVPLYGGFDGFNVVESDPFRNTGMTNATANNNYAFYSVIKALNSVSDPERVEMNLLTIPGITNASVTDQMISLAEARGDTLAILDLPSVYTPRHEGTTYGLGGGSTTGNGTSNLDNVVSTLKSRGINSSYACTYYPWVRVRDTINNATLWAPPSIAALGVFSSTDKKAEPWFAPAGFTRGGLSEGAAGIPVIQVSEQLTSKQRDKLYEANINPIAQFPAEGIVVFGQKTLQVTRSALDRINVRRLMIYLKKEVSRIAARLLFSPNVEVTWNTFLGQVNPLMASVKTRFGLDDYKVILDKTTTTPDLIDQNIMYAKIFLKPTKAIEFIAIDFVITNSGASFQD